MAIPTGAGTEVLKRVTKNGLNNAWYEILSGSADHIYTIISIIFCDQEAAAGTISIRVNDGANDIMFLDQQAFAARGTFVWNDKFVLYEDDDLDVFNSTDTGEWYVSYIDQHF